MPNPHVILLNKAPAPNRRPRFPLGGLGEFQYRVCARPSLPAAVGEAHRWPHNTRKHMKRILLPLLASSFLCACALAADEPKGTLDFKNAEVRQVLPIYKAVSGLDLVVDSRVKTVRWPVTLQSSEALPKAEATKLIEKALLEQAGIVITHLDGQRASVTHNDALAVTPAKK